MEAECSLTLQVSPGYGEEETQAGRHSIADFCQGFRCHICLFRPMHNKYKFMTFLFILRIKFGRWFLSQPWSSPFPHLAKICSLPSELHQRWKDLFEVLHVALHPLQLQNIVETYSWCMKHNLIKKISDNNPCRTLCSDTWFLTPSGHPWSCQQHWHWH